MSKKVKMLKKLIEEIDYYKESPTDSSPLFSTDFMVGYNKGLGTAISLLNEKIEYIERANRHYQDYFK